MILSVETYLDTLLAFVPQKKGNRFGNDYVSLIHVPAHGPERVYSLTHGKERSVLTVASYQEAVWEALQSAANGVDEDYHPQLDAMQAVVDVDHPVFTFLGADTLRSCGNASDGQPGMDYYLMLWQKDGEASVVECWEPYDRNLEHWLTVIGALNALSSQFEHAIAEAEL